jgi:lipopolysaccharide export system protein LptA
MKKLLLLSLLTLCFASTSVLFAQEKSSTISILKSDKLSAAGANSNITTLEGNVVLGSEKLNITKADSVIINKEENKLIVFGYNEFTFKGKIVVATTAGGKHTRLEYILGEDVLYLK